MPSPSPTPTTKSTPIRRANPTPTPTPTATPAPTATPTPDWPPQSLSDAWRKWVRDWSRPEVDAALRDSIAVFEKGLDGLEGLPKSDACAFATVFEAHLEIAQHLVDVHRLGNENVPGQHAGISWTVWLRFQRDLLVEAVMALTPDAECRSLLAPPTAAVVPGLPTPGWRSRRCHPVPRRATTPSPAATREDAPARLLQQRHFARLTVAACRRWIQRSQAGHCTRTQNQMATGDTRPLTWQPEGQTINLYDLHSHATIPVRIQKERIT